MTELQDQEVDKVLDRLDGIKHKLLAMQTDEADRLAGELGACVVDLAHTEADFTEVFVWFDGPPAPESGRFIDTHGPDDEGVGFRENVGPDDRAPDWSRRGDYWRLGPFLVATEDVRRA